MTAEEKAKVANFFELGDREDSDETTSSSETEDESETESDEDEDEEDDNEDEEDDDEDEEDDDEEEGHSGVSSLIPKPGSSQTIDAPKRFLEETSAQRMRGSRRARGWRRTVGRSEPNVSHVGEGGSGNSSGVGGVSSSEGMDGGRGMGGWEDATWSTMRTRPATDLHSWTPLLTLSHIQPLPTSHHLPLQVTGSIPPSLTR